jgi:hypothetical protein
MRTHITGPFVVTGRYHAWRHHKVADGYQLVLVSTLTGDIKDYGETYTRRRMAERICNIRNDYEANIRTDA